MLLSVLVTVAIAAVTSATLPCPTVSNGIDTLTLSLMNLQLPSINRSLFDTVYDCKPLSANVTRIIMTNDEVTHIDKDTFGMFFNLKFLQLAHNNISELHVDTFNRLRSLQELDLSYNKLTELQAGLLHIVSLVSVSFNHNTISYVEPGIVTTDNENLLYFYMNYNALNYLEPWPYMVYQTQSRNVDRRFYLQHNNISDFTNYMNWTYDLLHRYEVHVDMQNNALTTITPDMITQYHESLHQDSVFSVFLTYRLNISENNFFCDCNLFKFADVLRGSVLRSTRVEEFRYICDSPSKVAGKDWLHDVDMSELVCNVTDNCPSKCFCQDRPHNDTFYVDCNGAGLTEMPAVIPDNDRSKIELILDNNAISELTNVSYLDRVYNLSLRHNLIKSLDNNLIESLNAVTLDVSNNELRSLPSSIKKYSFNSVSVYGNPLWCDCDSMWMNDWITVDDVDASLTCDSDNGIQTIADMSLRDLGCTNEELIISLVVAGVVVAVILIALIFARRCPYETKVILNKITCGIFHPRDKYKVDDNTDKKEVDIYIVFDEEDVDVQGWVRYFMKKLINKYSILNPAQFMEPGSKAVNIPKWIGKSRRVIVILSEGIFENGDRNMEIDDAERRLVEAVTQNADKKNDDEVPIYDIDTGENMAEINTREDDNNLMNAPKLIYIKYNTSEKLNKRLDNEMWKLRLAEKNDKPSEWMDKLNEEPWKSRMASKRVLSPDETMFWSKLRYELPSKGHGTGGLFIPPHTEDDFANRDQPQRNGGMDGRNVMFDIDNEKKDKHGKGKGLKNNTKVHKKNVQPLVDDLSKILVQNRNQNNMFSGIKAGPSNTDTFRKLVGQDNNLNTGVNGRTIGNRINVLGGNNPLAALTSNLKNLPNNGRNVPYSNNMNNGKIPFKKGFPFGKGHSDDNSRCSSATSRCSASHC